MDIHTSNNGLRCYARVCTEVDATKPLPPKIRVGRFNKLPMNFSLQFVSIVACMIGRAFALHYFTTQPSISAAQNTPPSAPDLYPPRLSIRPNGSQKKQLNSTLMGEKPNSSPPLPNPAHPPTLSRQPTYLPDNPIAQPKSTPSPRSFLKIILNHSPLASPALSRKVIYEPAVDRVT